MKGTASTGVGASRDDTIVDVIHLLPRVAAGDELAVRECVDRYGPLIWALARRWSPDPRGVEDAVQEVFVDLWRSAGRYDATRATEAGWVAMVTRRRLIDRTRTATRPRLVARLPRGTRRHGGPALMNQFANTTSDPHMPDEFEPTAHELLAGELTAAMLTENQGAGDQLPPALAARITATGEALVRARTVPPITAPGCSSAPRPPFMDHLEWLAGRGRATGDRRPGASAGRAVCGRAGNRRSRGRTS
ncbi:sigma factor [Gemmatimonas sp.]|uniref:RNA polymerase sigma factor n=1 Tax=Gemmatimonas sp. TaxID=1962908 RepID=UPI003DA40E37